MSQALFKEIVRPKNGHRFAIGDVHGCSQTLETLVWQKLKLQPEDQLFFLGDYIDRGPDSVGVLDFIIGLQTAGYQVYPLRGNHEQMLLDAWTSFQKLSTEEKTQEDFIDRIRDKSLADTQNNCLIPRFEQWLNDLPYYYELDDFFLVHAGFNFKKEQPFEDFHSMMWVMRFSEGRYNAQKANNKRIIHGHRKTPVGEINRAIDTRAKVLPLDNGCYAANLSEYGNLCALNIDTRELLCQRNLDME